MGINAFVYGFETYSNKSETANTDITQEIKGKPGSRLALLNLLYTTTGTAHTLYLIYADGEGSRNTVDGDTDSGQKVVDVVDTPKDPAGNAAGSGDVVAYLLKNGEWEFNTIDSVSTKEITLNDDIGSPGIADGAKFNILGASGDGAEFVFEVGASEQAEFKGEPYVVHPYVGEPFWFRSGNATDAGSIDNMLFALINK